MLICKNHFRVLQFRYGRSRHEHLLILQGLPFEIGQATFTA